MNDTIPVEEKREILQSEFDIPMTQTLERRFREMCNLSMYVEQRGLAKGIAQGREEGRSEGITERAISDLKNLMETLGLSLEQAMAALKVPETEQQVYTELLKQ